MRYGLFLLTFISITDWLQIWLFMLALIRPAVKKSKLIDKKILNLIKDKAGFTLKNITIIDSDKMYGGMSGIPGIPAMFLSSKLLKNLNKDELEYVLLHEAGHFKYYHPIILVFTQIILITTGLYIASFLTISSAMLLGILFSVIFIRIARATERTAENFSASHMKNPRAMLTAVKKFNDNWNTSRIHALRKPLSWNVSYNEKRSIANKYIK